MANFGLLSILIMTIAVPLWYAKSPSPRAGLRRVVLGMAAYIVLWIGYCTYIFLRLGGGF
jgi:hypothetical protein